MTKWHSRRARLRRLSSVLLWLVLLFLGLPACSRSKASELEGDPLPSSVTRGPGGSSGPSRFLAYPERDFHPADVRPPEERGGVLRVAIPDDLPTLNAHAIGGPYFQWFGRLVWDNLIYRDAEGNHTPWLARSWDISPDGRTYTFHLREDVTFSDGSKFNAEAVRINLDHMVDPKTKSSLAGRYIAPYRRGEVVDEFTFRAHLAEPYAPFLDVLAQSYLGMFSPQAILKNPSGLAAMPVGSGPFLLKEYKRQQGLIFERRPDYRWGPGYRGNIGPAYLERIVMDIVPEPVVRAGGLSSGQHDLVIDIAPQSAASLRENPSLVVSNRVRQGNPTRIITFNTQRAPFDDVRIRRAVALATDKQAIARLLGFGEFFLKTDFLCAPTRHYDPSFQEALGYRPAEAEKVLDEAGWVERDAEGFRTRGGQRLRAEVVFTESLAAPGAGLVSLQSDLKRVGFDLVLVHVPALKATEIRQAGDYQALGGGGWHTNTPDGLYILYHSGEIITDKTFGQNTFRLSDSVLDQLLSEARRTTESERQRQLYSAAQRRLTELVPGVPIFESQSLVAYHRRLRGLVFDTSHNTVVLSGAWLERPKR
jgi:peptide/nickel transport system substrate-binding protein